MDVVLRASTVRDGRAAAGLVGAVLAARPDMVVVETGLPAWAPPT